jgi:hypothetical protein
VARGPRAGSARDDYYLYDVTFEGETIVVGSRSPECDAARVLLDRGFTGPLAILDANTGKHRTTVNIEAAAKVTVIESRNQSLRLLCKGASLGAVPCRGSACYNRF